MTLFLIFLSGLATGACLWLGVGLATFGLLCWIMDDHPGNLDCPVGSSTIVVMWPLVLAVLVFCLPRYVVAVWRDEV